MGWHAYSALLAIAALSLARPVQGEHEQTSDAEWQSWLANFGHDSFSYPSWITEQMSRCTCSPRAEASTDFDCFDGPVKVDWREASELTWCVSKHWLLTHMPSFDLLFLPGAVSVQGLSMLDDNIAFALMAWNASWLSPRPPLQVVLSYVLPYASYHESRVNWRPLYFAKYFSHAVKHVTSRDVIDALINGGTPLMNWTSYQWPSSPRAGSTNRYELGPFASGSAPPVVGPFDFTAYGYGSCTGWSTVLVSALRAVGVPARPVGSPCWNTGQFSGLATSNANVSFCWHGGRPGGPYGGVYLNNHNWVEYWDNQAKEWRFTDVASSSSAQKTWFCGQYTDGCECSANAGRASPDHDILAATWSSPHERNNEVDGGEVIDVGTGLRLSTGEPVSPLVWSPSLTSPLGHPLKDVGLRVVNRTEFYRCKSKSTETPEKINM